MKSAIKVVEIEKAMSLFKSVSIQSLCYYISIYTYATYEREASQSLLFSKSLLKLLDHFENQQSKT